MREGGREEVEGGVERGREGRSGEKELREGGREEVEGGVERGWEGRSGGRS